MKISEFRTELKNTSYTVGDCEVYPIGQVRMNRHEYVFRLSCLSEIGIAVEKDLDLPDLRKLLAVQQPPVDMQPKSILAQKIMQAPYIFWYGKARGFKPRGASNRIFQPVLDSSGADAVLVIRYFNQPGLYESVDQYCSPAKLYRRIWYESGAKKAGFESWIFQLNSVD